MKIKDAILAGVITLNLLFGVFALAMVVADSEPATYAGATVDRGKFLRKCTLKIGDTREGLVVIDTLKNKMLFYVPTQGRKEVLKVGQAIDLSLAFRHPK